MRGGKTQAWAGVERSQSYPTLLLRATGQGNTELEMGNSHSFEWNLRLDYHTDLDILIIDWLENVLLPEGSQKSHKICLKFIHGQGRSGPTGHIERRMEDTDYVTLWLCLMSHWLFNETMIQEFERWNQTILLLSLQDALEDTFALEYVSESTKFYRRGQINPVRTRRNIRHEELQHLI